MQSDHFYIRHGKLRFSSDWRNLGCGKDAAQALFAAVSAEFCPRVALRAVSQCCLWPYLLAFPILELGTAARYALLNDVVSRVGDTIPGEGFFPLGPDGASSFKPADKIVPAPDYPGIAAGSLSARAIIALHNETFLPAPARAPRRVVASLVPVRAYG